MSLYNEAIKKSSGTVPTIKTSSSILFEYLKKEVPQCPCLTHQSSECVDLALNMIEHNKMHQNHKSTNWKAHSSGDLKLIDDCCKLALWNHVYQEKLKETKHRETLRKKTNNTSPLKKNTSPRRGVVDLRDCV